jgi:hypothetical protein
LYLLIVLKKDLQTYINCPIDAKVIL